MRGTVIWWNPRLRYGYIKAAAGLGRDSEQTFFFRGDWAVDEAQRHTFKRGEQVVFDGDRAPHPRTKRQKRVAYRVTPLPPPPQTNVPR